jgi:hypothetical protein
MSHWLRKLILSLLGVLGAFACKMLILSVLPAPPWHIGSFLVNGRELLALVLGITLLFIGIWMHRASTTALQLVSGLIAPLVWWAFWAWGMWDLEQKDGFLFPAHVFDYVGGSAPLPGVTLGYVYSASRRQMRSSV